MCKILFFVIVAGLFAGCGGCQSGGKSALLRVGAAAPEVSGADQNGQTHKLSETMGAYTVVYFYPKDQTPGCTEEACAFRDVWKKYEAADVKLFGVSKGSSDSHLKFATKHTLPFPLIADENEVWGAAFGVSTALGMYKRVSFLIGKDGKVAKVYGDVDPGVHAGQILEDIAALQSATATAL